MSLIIALLTPRHNITRETIIIIRAFISRRGAFYALVIIHYTSAIALAFTIDNYFQILTLCRIGIGIGIGIRINNISRQTSINIRMKQILISTLLTISQ